MDGIAGSFTKKQPYLCSTTIIFMWNFEIKAAYIPH